MGIKNLAKFMVVAWGAVAVAMTSAVASPPTYSVDFQGPTAVPPGGSGPFSAADILSPGGPSLTIPAGFAGAAGTLAIGGFGINSEDEVRELDALSYGLDGQFFPEDLKAAPLFPDREQFRQSWTFSVDEFAVGNGLGIGPSVSTEGAGGAREASADIYRSRTGPGGFGFLGAGTNVGVFDGNGAAPFGGPGLDLVEPNPPSVGGLADEGDNLDAWDLDTPVSRNEFPPSVYFSLDSHFPEPFEPGPPVNTGTAVANGFVGGDVLVSDLSGAAPGLFADSRFLGLNGGMPFDSPNDLDVDDLDALVLWNNDNPEYDPVTGPYSWMEGTDMLLFSLRRNSELLQTPTLDALGSGMEITEGDILVPVQISATEWAPGIFINAEALGIATVRSGGGKSWGVKNPRYEDRDIWDDELDALDVQQVEAPILDANFDNDSDVDGIDFLTWQQNFPTAFGASNATGDADGDGDVDQMDRAIWHSQYGVTPAPPIMAVPEPSSLLLGICAAALIPATRKRSRS